MLALWGLVLFTDPQNTPAIILILPFILIFIIIYQMSAILLKYYVRSLSGNKNKKRSFFSVIIALVPVSILVLQSIGQLTTRDIITLAVLALLTCFYITRFSFLQD
jgi:Na+/melibiose symporter-like transporter